MKIPQQLTKQAGITLIEVLTVIAIISTLVSMGTPHFGGIMAKKDLSSARTSLLVSLNKAKNIARTQSTIVDVSITGHTITLSPGNSVTNEVINMPATVNAEDQRSFRFSAMGMATTQADVALDSNMTITIKPTNDSSLSSLITVTPMGIITASDTVVTQVAKL